MAVEPKFTIEKTSSAETHYELMALVKLLGIGLNVCQDGQSQEPYLLQIHDRLLEIRDILSWGYYASEALRGKAETILQAHEHSAQEYMHWVEEPQPIDYHPFAAVPPGTTVKDLPDGGRLFTLADGVFVQVTADLKFSSVEKDGTSYTIAPVGAKVTLRDGRELLLKKGIPSSTHEAAGVEGLPYDIEPQLVAESRYRIELSDGTLLDISQGGGFLTIVNPSGTVVILGISRIEGIGETVDVRLLCGGAKSFSARESGHRGIVEAGGTVHLSLANGQDLVIRFPETGDGNGGSDDDGPCGLVCEVRD